MKNKRWFWIITSCTVFIIILIFIAYFLLKSDNSPAGISSASNFSVLDWQDLRNLNVHENKLPANIADLDGTQIKIAGFIIPLEDTQRVVKEFLLVPSPMACIHVPPPPPNQIIYVRMAPGRTAKMTFSPIWLFGILRIDHRSDKSVKNAFEMVGLATQPYYTTR